ATVALVAGVSFGAYGLLSPLHRGAASVAGPAGGVAPSQSEASRYAMYYAPVPHRGAADSNSYGVIPLSSGTVPEVPVSTGYVDGVYTGRRESAYYGIVQVQAIVQGGNLIDVKILSYPNDNGTSRYINSVALPTLIRESISAQGSHVNFVSGATFTSEAFHLSLHLALVQAVG
ncbi:MAG TPA: hypothetical protein VMW69_09990, partial [Spirochaetia bacterium]|nr:hypothetical protein [Spirochaetia bacterium]